jgi:hypothetical protein
MMKFSLKTVTVFALLVALHLAKITCPRGSHWKDDYDMNRSNRWMTSSVLRGYCMGNDNGCENYDGVSYSCKKCNDGWEKKKDTVTGDYC